ncbi:unnamed protein product, partial [Polarella glacialis]
VSAAPGAVHSAGAQTGPCKFFGSAKGCSSEGCGFSHDNPNSVAPCSFHQKGLCERGDACTYRHAPWTSADEARRHYGTREAGAVATSVSRFKQLRREEPATTASASGGTSTGAAASRLGKEHVELEGEIEREFQEETYGSNALRMMEKMGYKAGGGLGKENQGRTSLVSPCLALGRASQSGGPASLGFGEYTGAGRATAAERAARLADLRAQKRQKVCDGSSFVQHNLLSSDESSDGEAEHVKARDVKLAAG